MQTPFSLIVVAALMGCIVVGSIAPASADAPPCSEAWRSMVEEILPTGDGQGHGPDVGSEEWQSVMEFKLGIRGKTEVPALGTDDWCRHIDSVLREQGLLQDGASAQGPSFDCEQVSPGSIEALICDNSDLAALDIKLNRVFVLASNKAKDGLARLQAEQRGWIKGRNDCWKSEDKVACVREEYIRRIAGLQAWYRLVFAAAPAFYTCDGNPASEIVATCFQTDPPTLIAERGDRVSLMYRQPGDGDAAYHGRNEKLWEKDGVTFVQWGFDAPVMHCQPRPHAAGEGASP